MQRLTTYCIFLLVLITGCVKQPLDQNEVAITEKLTALTGKEAIICGLVRKEQNPSEAWRCAENNDLTGKPFWFAMEDWPTDAAIWHIIARTASGKRYVIFYTSNNSGQSQFAPKFGEYECNEPFRFFLHDMFPLRCGQDVP